MLKTLIRRELLDNLRTFRFAAVLLITLLLVVANAVVLIQDYEQRLESYNNTVKMHYAREYREFVIDTDRADPESLHVVGIREGMSQKSVSPEAIPKFKDTLSINRDFNTAATDLLCCWCCFWQSLYQACTSRSCVLRFEWVIGKLNDAA